MGDTLERVDDGAGKIVGGVDVPVPASTVVRRRLLSFPVGESVNDRVSHGAVARVKGNASANAVLSAEIRAVLHLTEHGQTLLGRTVSSCAGKTVLSVRLLDLGVRVVGIGISVEDHLLRNIVQLLEVITGVADRHILDVHELQVVKNRVLKLLLLLLGVGIIESNKELAVAVGGSLGEVVVQEGSLGVTDVKVTTCIDVSGNSRGDTERYRVNGDRSLPGLRRESSNDTVLNVGQSNVVVGTSLLLLNLGLALFKLVLQLRVGVLEELEPTGDVGMAALAYETDGNLVGAQSSPDLLVDLANGVSAEVGSESEVLVELGDQGTDGLEVGRGEHWSSALSVEAHDGGRKGRFWWSEKYEMAEWLARSCVVICGFARSVVFIFYLYRPLLKQSGMVEEKVGLSCPN